MKTIHFVYVLPGSRNILHKLYRKITGKIISRYDSVSKYYWPSPLRAPQSITYNVGKYLEGQYRVKFYDLSEIVTINPEPGDILLGHLSADHQSIVQNSISDSRYSKRYLIQPYNNSESQIGWLREVLPMCDGFFAIGGDYWEDHINDSPLKQFRHKLIHLNMAVDSLSYPVVKNDFRPPGKRRFFYIGRTGRFGDEKGITLLEELADRIPDFEGGYICAGADIRGWKKIASPTKLTPSVVKQIAGEYDIFINMSRADAQATTILEAMSWGFPIACTSQSGYSREASFFYLSLDDMEKNIRTIADIQSLSSGKLKELSLENRKIVETKYSWDVFLTKIDKFLRSE